MTAPGAPVAPRRSADAQVLGALLVLAGVFWLLQRSGLVGLSWQAVLSILLAALGVGMVLTAGSRGGRGLIALGVAMTAVLASTSSIDVGVLQEGVGERALRPRTAAEADAGLAVGTMDVDLTGLDVPAGTTRLTYRMGVGELHLTLPDRSDDLGVRVVATVRAGELTVLGGNRDGADLERTFEDPNYDDAPRKLEVVVTMGIGNVQVDRAFPF